MVRAQDSRQAAVASCRVAIAVTVGLWVLCAMWASTWLRLWGLCALMGAYVSAVSLGYVKTCGLRPMLAQWVTLLFYLLTLATVFLINQYYFPHTLLAQLDDHLVAFAPGGMTGIFVLGFIALHGASILLVLAIAAKHSVKRYGPLAGVIIVLLVYVLLHQLAAVA